MQRCDRALDERNSYVNLIGADGSGQVRKRETYTRAQACVKNNQAFTSYKENLARKCI